MPTFYCKLGAADGRVLEQEFEASGRDLLRASLEEQGFHVFQIRKRPLRLLAPGSGRGGWTSRRFLTFNQELLVLLKAGLPIIQILDALLERQDAGSSRQVLTEVREDIRGGSSISDAFAKVPRYFPSLYVASLKAGERTGDLPVTIERYIAYQKRVEAIKAKVKNASFYPILLTIAVCLVLAFLLTFVVPRFTQVYADANVQLPLITRIVMGLADWLVAGLPLVVPLVLVGVPLLRVGLTSERGRVLVDRLALRLPYFGSLLNEYAVLSFCRTLGTTLASGIPVLQAMQMARGTLNNQVLEERMAAATRKVEEGTALATALEETEFFPSLALRMVAVGETGGDLAGMLEEIAGFYEGEVERRLDRVTTLIEPILMASMGLLIGGVVVAMYIPIFQLAGTVG